MTFHFWRITMSVNDRRKMHMLKRFGQRITLCKLVIQYSKAKAVRPSMLTNTPVEVTCKNCLKLIRNGET